MNVLGNLNRRDYPETCTKEMECVSPSVMDNLQRQKKALEDQLTKVNDAINALEKNPEVHKVLELIARV